MSNVSFVNETRERIRLLQEQIAAAYAWTKEAKPDFREEILAPYREMLDELYEEDLPLAKLADDSDLLLHVTGSAASGSAPRVGLLARLLTQTRDEVTRLAKQVARVESLRVPAALDMSFVGVAAGSLFIGFSATDASSAGDSTREAVDAIGEAGSLVAEGATLEHIADRLPDPLERDLAVAAIRRLAPSGNVGIHEVEILGRRFKHPVGLTTETRRNARAILSRPVHVTEQVVQLVGTIREVDLDASRFELRNVEGATEDVRCAHELSEAEAKELIDRRVRVLGRAERDKRGAIRLLWIDEVEPLDA